MAVDPLRLTKFFDSSPALAPQSMSRLEMQYGYIGEEDFLSATAQKAFGRLEQGPAVVQPSAAAPGGVLGGQPPRVPSKLPMLEEELVCGLTPRQVLQQHTVKPRSRGSARPQSASASTRRPTPSQRRGSGSSSSSHSMAKSASVPALSETTWRFGHVWQPKIKGNENPDGTRRLGSSRRPKSAAASRRRGSAGSKKPPQPGHRTQEQRLAASASASAIEQFQAKHIVMPHERREEVARIADEQRARKMLRKARLNRQRMLDIMRQRYPTGVLGVDSPATEGSLAYGPATQAPASRRSSRSRQHTPSYAQQRAAILAEHFDGSTRRGYHILTTEPITRQGKTLKPKDPKIFQAKKMIDGRKHHDSQYALFGIPPPEKDNVARRTYIRNQSTLGKSYNIITSAQYQHVPPTMPEKKHKRFLNAAVAAAHVPVDR